MSETLKTNLGEQESTDANHASNPMEGVPTFEEMQAHRGEILHQEKLIQRAFDIINEEPEIAFIDKEIAEATAGSLPELKLPNLRAKAFNEPGASLLRDVFLLTYEKDDQNEGLEYYNDRGHDAHDLDTGNILLHAYAKALIEEQRAEYPSDDTEIDFAADCIFSEVRNGLDGEVYGNDPDSHRAARSQVAINFFQQFASDRENGSVDTFQDFAKRELQKRERYQAKLEQEGKLLPSYMDAEMGVLNFVQGIEHSEPAH